MLEKCRYCGFEHEDFKHIFFRRNHVSNRVLSHCLHCLRRLYQVPYRPELNIKKEGNIMALHYKEELKNLVILTQTILAKNACEILKRKDISSTIHSLILDEKIKSKIVDVKCRDGKIRPMKILYSMDATDEVVFKFEKSFKTYRSDNLIRDHFNRILKTKNLIIDSEIKIFQTLICKKDNCIKKVVYTFLDMKHGLFRDWKIIKINE